MQQIKRRLALFAVMMIIAVVGSLLLVVPAHAAPAKAGRAEGSRTWWDSAQGRFYTMHVVHAVIVDTVPSPDKWRYQSRGYCTYTPTGSSSDYSTPCNMNFFGASLAACDYFDCSEGTLSRPWGSRNFECDNDNNCIFDGQWHNTPGGYNGIISITTSIQFRFLASTGDHLTNVYAGCSYVVHFANYSVTRPIGCTPLRS
jgi:hypothetical protein